MGKLKVELPCNIGDTVYKKWISRKNKICFAQLIITSIELIKNGATFYCISKNEPLYTTRLFLKDFGVIWFIDKDEAKTS